MRNVYTGAAWKFGDGVTTDDILPGQYLDRKNEEAGAFAMAGIDPDFAKRVNQGDMIVAGQNFGAGSGRENAIFAIRDAGLPVVIAESFSRLFFRNAVNNGLIPVIVPSTAAIDTGHELRVDIEARAVEDLTTGERYPILNLTGISREVLEAGGIIAFTEQRLAARRKAGRQ